MWERKVKGGTRREILYEMNLQCKNNKNRKVEAGLKVKFSEDTELMSNVGKKSKASYS